MGVFVAIPLGEAEELVLVVDVEILAEESADLCFAFEVVVAKGDGGVLFDLALLGKRKYFSVHLPIAD